MNNPLPPSTVSLEHESDQDLVARVRDGDTRAYAALWTRHSGPAYAVGRTFTTLDADDLVAEAFLKVLEAIQSGGGPTGAFRPYITMAVRNIGRSLYVREPVMLDTDFDRRGTDHLNGEVVAVNEFERGATLEAFQTLPPRWQEALWYSEVDGLKVGVIGTYLGIPANAVSALLIRARRGLRDAWISAQLARARTPECEPVIRELGGYVRDSLSARTHSKLEAHLATCDSCTAALAEARRTSSQLALVLLPAVAGTAGAAAYAADATAPAMPQALLAMGDEPASDPTAVEPAPDTRRRSILAAALLLLLFIGAISAAVIVTQPDAPISLAGEVSTVSPTPSPSSTSTSSPTPTPTSAPSPAASVVPSPLPSTLPPSERPPAPAPETPSADPGAEAPSSPSPGTDGPQAVPAPPESVPPSQEPPVLEAPSSTLAQSDPRMYPWVNGSGALPGATIELIDESGSIVGTGSVDATGGFRVAVVDGSSGAHEVRARQSLDGATSPAGTALAFTTSPAPAIAAPLDGGLVDALRFSFTFDAEPGSIVQRQIVDVTPVQTLRVPSSGTWNERLAVSPGEHTLRVRHADPTTGDVGPFAEIHFTAR